MVEIRRRLAALFLVAPVLCTLTNCTAPPVNPLDGRGPIVLIDSPDISSGAQLHNVVELWNRQHAYSERVTFIEGPHATDEYRAQLRARAQTADSPEHQSQCYDVMAMDILWTPEFARAGYLQPLDPADFQMDRFLRRPVDAVTLEGRTWAIPHRADAGLLYYRKDLLDAAGFDPPTTWDELRRQAVTIGARNGIGGYIGQFDRYEGFTVNVIEMIWAVGGDVLDDNGRIMVNEPAARTGVQMLADGIESGDGTGWIPRAALGYNERLSHMAFQDGDAVFLRNWPYVYRLLDDPKSPLREKFDVAPLPGPSALGGWNLGISSCSRSPATARDFIKFVTSEANQRLLFEKAGFPPTIADLYQDPALRQQFPYLDVLRQAIEDSRTRPTIPAYDDVSALVQEHLHRALSDPVSAGGMTDLLAEKLAAMLRAR